ncbi:hypothetical protein MTR_7g106560 [Medicago truncatula]|uniref:Uncharacterized protein n=1 Tax=Medicago truncatula TaxID=3880 RepID=A0A072U539_MEDTR|nr:hypothetical protein MTR_7g106560 [Medicago truncatula]
MHQRTYKVENVDDRKPRVFDSIKVEAPAKVEAFVKVEASSVNSDVWKLVTTKWTRLIYFRPKTHGKIKTNCSVGSADKQIGLDLRLSLEDLVKVRGYVVREDNACKLAILNGVHNHKMVPYVAWHLLAGRLTEYDKKIVHDLTDSSVKPKNILTNLKKKRKESMINIKQVYNERHKFKREKRGDLTEMQYLISKLDENG